MFVNKSSVILKTMDVEQTIRNYIHETVHMSLATCINNRPWVCEVHFSYDDELNFYFRSKPGRRHSMEMLENSNVAGNIVTQHEIDEKVRGVYFEGIGYQMDEVDANHVGYTSYCERFGRGPEILKEVQEEDGHKFYVIKVRNFVLFDSRVASPGVKHELPWP